MADDQKHLAHTPKTRFAVCECGQMKYDRQSLQWWVLRGTSWHFIGKLDAGRRDQNLDVRIGVGVRVAIRN